ncbi:MAG TPA: LysR family transcriptional regulator [Xanthobacteraceae bacterium]|jgi:DNA-binding transcriptional LysR family regulator
MALDARVRRRLKLRDFDTLLAVAEHGSMAKAAARLAVSQPTVSKTIADMEHALGVRLFDRTAQGVEPNQYGHALLKWAVVMFDDVKQGVEEIEFLADPSVGTLRIGATEPMLGGFLAAVVARVHQRYPKITFEISQPPSFVQQRRDLLERRCDLTLGRVMTSDSERDFATEILFEEPGSVVAGPQNPLLRRRKLKLAELLDQPWTLPRLDSVVGNYLTEAFRVAGLPLPGNVVICGSIQMHQALLVNGPFLAIFPKSLLRFGAKHLNVKVLPVALPGRPPPVGITMLKNRTLNPIIQRFIACAREIAKS